jgi:hypothetical protein
MSDEMVIRKVTSILEETCMDAGKRLGKPSRKCATIAVIENPYSGRYVEDLSLLYSFGERLGNLLVARALKTLGMTNEEAREGVEGYGKGAVVGLEGEMEHPHAITHPKFGAPVRSALGGVDYCKAIIPSTIKMGTVGTQIDVPIVHKRALWVVSHFDTMTVSLPDAPLPNEIMVALVLTDSGRALERTAGLKKADVKGMDGLR